MCVSVCVCECVYLQAQVNKDGRFDELHQLVDLHHEGHRHLDVGKVKHSARTRQEERESEREKERERKKEEKRERVRE